MSRSQRRRRYQFASLSCWGIALTMWIADLATTSTVFIAAALVVTLGALGCTITAAANS